MSMRSQTTSEMLEEQALYCVAMYNGPGCLRTVQLSEDGEMLYVGDVSSDISVWHLGSPALLGGKDALTRAKNKFLKGSAAALQPGSQPCQQNVLHQARPIQVSKMCCITTSQWTRLKSKQTQIGAAFLLYN